MNVIENVNGSKQTIESPEHVIVPQPARRRGRPRGSKNKPKVAHSQIPAREEGWEITKKIGRPRSLAAHRKWQRDFVLPQFVLNRKQAQDLLVKYLRSKPGIGSLTTIISDGFTGTSKMTDAKLGEFLVGTNLLSRYPHEIVIRGS